MGKRAILDSCFLIRSLNGEHTSVERKLLERLTVEGVAKCVTKTILKEVDRWVAAHEGSVASQEWRNLAAQLVVLRPNQADVIWEAGRILTHYPDNQHIATAKIENSLLVSYDHTLVRTARDEGVAAYYPMELLAAC